MNNNTRTVLMVVLVVVVIGALVFFLYPKASVAPTDGTASTTPEQTTGAVKGSGGIKNPLPSGVSSSPVVPLSKLISIKGSEVSLYAGVDPAGRTVYTAIPGADGATFKALTQPVVVEEPTEKKGLEISALGKGSAAYYKDKSRIYVLSIWESDAETRAALQVVQEADLATFAPTKSVWYAKDKNGIFRLEARTGTGAHAAGSYTWAQYDLTRITNIDAASFVLADGGTYDAHDNKHKYRKGVEVGTYP